ncbi:MAG: cytoplasmic protein [bacterium]|nr:cytoplasmic protein [bacterium]
MTDDQQNNLEFNIDRTNLYREESFSDLKTGTIKRFTPVKADGSGDKSRKTIFVGHTSILTPNGPLPIQNNIPAKDLQQAIKKFPEVMQQAMGQLIEEVKRYQEQEQSQIQKPDSGLIIPGR